MGLPRFYTPQLASMTASGFDSGELETGEARHAAAVLRLATGQQVLLFDGQGREALAELVRVDKNRVGYRICRWLDRDLELPHSLTLAIALPKGDRQKTLVDAATELGVSQLVPIHTRRGVAQPTEGALERLQRGVIEASKQCGRNRLMQVGQPLTLEQFAQPAADGTALREASPLRLVAHPLDSSGNRSSLSQALSGSPRPVSIAIGPEGGFTDEEIARLAVYGWQVVDLGRTILRVEIAAIAAVSQIAAWLNRPSATHGTNSQPT